MIVIIITTTINTADIVMAIIIVDVIIIINIVIIVIIAALIITITTIFAVTITIIFPLVFITIIRAASRGEGRKRGQGGGKGREGDCPRASPGVAGEGGVVNGCIDALPGAQRRVPVAIDRLPLAEDLLCKVPLPLRVRDHSLGHDDAQETLNGAEAEENHQDFTKGREDPGVPLGLQ